MVSKFVQIGIAIVGLGASFDVFDKKKKKAVKERKKRTQAAIYQFRNQDKDFDEKKFMDHMEDMPTGEDTDLWIKKYDTTR